MSVENRQRDDHQRGGLGGSLRGTSKIFGGKRGGPVRKRRQLAMSFLNGASR